MGVMGVKFFEPPSSSFQGGFHISHQASLLPEERGCNRPLVLGTATLKGWRGIKALRHILRDGTALLKVDRIIEVLVLWLFADSLQISCVFLGDFEKKA